MKAATLSGRQITGWELGRGKRKEKVELRDKGEKSLGKSTDCNLSARNEQDNIK